MFRPLFCRPAPFLLVLGCSRPLVGVDAEGSEIVQETLHPLFFLASHTARAPTISPNITHFGSLVSSMRATNPANKIRLLPKVAPMLIKYQSRLWSQRGTKVNESNHGDNPLLRSTRILIATKRYATLQAMATTNILKWFIKHPYSISREGSIDLACCRLSTTDRRSQQQSGQITLQAVLINKSKFLKVTHRTKMRKIEMPRSMVKEALSW